MSLISIDHAAPPLVDHTPFRTDNNRHLSLSFFGQINPHRGVDVLLEACASLPKRTRKRLEVHIHGENKHFRDIDFGWKVDRLAEETRDVVRMMASYRNQEIVSLMRGSGWTIVPSIRWENSPIVIQEARMAGRPMIYFDTGGITEKVDPEADLPFSAGNPGALDDVIRSLVGGDFKLNAEVLSAQAGSRHAFDAENYSRHMALYEGYAPEAEEREQIAS